MTSLTTADKQEIGQHFVFGFHGHEISEDVKVLIRDYHVGNIILMKRNVQSVKQVYRLAQSLQQLAKDSGHSRPLMIGIDQENGLVSAFSRTTVANDAGTQFPGAMALAATGSIEIAEDCSAATAREMRLAGINWAYSPVADVNSNPKNPVIGVRSFGDGKLYVNTTWLVLIILKLTGGGLLSQKKDPDEVAKYASAVSRGLTRGEVASCAKHFPGHGDTYVDSHLALPVINKTENELMETELVPFYTLIKSGVPTIMTGHMALPLVTGDSTPCSLSKTITTDLLREKMGYGGVVVTDCLEMNAVAAPYTPQRGAVMALQAGADIVMICHTMQMQMGAIEETYVAIENGSLSLESLRQSGERIAALKLAYAGTSWADVFRPFQEQVLVDLLTRNAHLSAEAYAASTTLIRGPLPVINDDRGRVLVMTPVTESLNRAVDDNMPILMNSSQAAGPHYLAFAQSVALRVNSRHLVYTPLPMHGQGQLPDEISGALGAASAIIFVTRSADRSGWQVDYLRRLLHEKRGNTPIITLASCGPYDVVGAPDIQEPILASFEYTASALEAAAGVIFGEHEAMGRLPVSL
ncbi:glycoside hydrolase family 3 protein [Pisolithus albus]|nr:glycoside hydrolase family 3 protein [Pisolithus albus]